MHFELIILIAKYCNKNDNRGTRVTSSAKKNQNWYAQSLCCSWVLWDATRRTVTMLTVKISLIITKDMQPLTSL